MWRVWAVRWTRGGFFFLAGVFGAFGWALLVGGIQQFHRRVDRGGHVGLGPALFGISEPWEWTDEAQFYALVGAMMLFVATMALSHRIVTGRGGRWWEYILLVIPVVGLYAVARMYERIRQVTPGRNEKLRVYRAVWLLGMAVVLNAVWYTEAETPWADPAATFVEVTRGTEIFGALQVLILASASAYAVAVLPTSRPNA